MHDPIRVAVLGTEQMGSGIVSLLLDEPGPTLVGAYARRKKRCGIALGTAIGLGRVFGLKDRG